MLLRATLYINKYSTTDGESQVNRRTALEWNFTFFMDMACHNIDIMRALHMVLVTSYHELKSTGGD